MTPKPSAVPLTVARYIITTKDKDGHLKIVAHFQQTGPDAGKKAHARWQEFSEKDPTAEVWLRAIELMR